MDEWTVDFFGSDPSTLVSFCRSAFDLPGVDVCPTDNFDAINLPLAFARIPPSKTLSSTKKKE